MTYSGQLLVSLQWGNQPKIWFGHNFWLEGPIDLRTTRLNYILQDLFRDTLVKCRRLRSESKKNCGSAYYVLLFSWCCLCAIVVFMMLSPYYYCFHDVVSMLLLFSWCCLTSSWLFFRPPQREEQRSSSQPNLMDYRFIEGGVYVFCHEQEISLSMNTLWLKKNELISP